MTSPHQQEEPKSQVSHDNIENLLLENAALRRDLEDCKDQLFEVLQKGNGITESDIKATFSRVYSGIDTWIDELGSEDGYEEAFRDKFIKNNRRDGSGLAYLGFHRRCYSDVTWRVKFSNLPQCFPIIMSMLISKFLTKYIFRTAKTDDEWGNLYPHGLTEDEIKHLVQMQDVMRTKLRRDESEISRWRGQTISAMINFDTAKKRAKEASNEHSSALQKRLLDWLGKPISSLLLQSLMENIINRANKSLEMMCCSNKTYIIGSLEFPPGPIAEHEEARAWHLKDLITWKKMSPQADGDLLQCLHPGLMRIGESGQDDLLLVKPTWMGYEKRGELPEDPVQSPPPASRSPSPLKQNSNLEKHGEREHKNRSKRARPPNSSWVQKFFPAGEGSLVRSTRSGSRSTSTDSPLYPPTYSSPRPVQQYIRQLSGDTERWVPSRGPSLGDTTRRGSTFPIVAEEHPDQTRQILRNRRSFSQ